jgi:transcriptional regulator with XRE-family HTH domain
MQTFLTGLRGWRQRHGVTLEELSGLTGYSIPKLSLVERGKRRLRPLERVRIARLLRERVRVLFPLDSATGAAGRATDQRSKAGDERPPVTTRG